MLIYWCIVVIRKFVWLWRLPKPEEIARADRNERCGVCGATNGRMRCVTLQKDGPRAPGVRPEEKIARQHRCKECGAGWHHDPIVKGLTTGNTMPSVARTRMEQREDSRAYLQSQQTDNTTN